MEFYLKQTDEVCDWCGKEAKDHIMVEVGDTDWCWREREAKHSDTDLDEAKKVKKLKDLKDKGDKQPF